MYTILFTYICSLFLISCSSQPLDDYREEGNGLARSLTETLKTIHTREELLKAAPQIKHRFNELVNLAIDANDYAYRHPESEKLGFSPDDHALSDSLREEMNRICHLEGGREILEKCQEEALHRLDAYLNKIRK